MVLNLKATKFKFLYVNHYLIILDKKLGVYTMIQIDKKRMWGEK